MDHLERLEKAISSIEEDASVISQIAEVVNTMKSAESVLQQEGATIKSAVKEMDDILTALHDAKKRIKGLIDSGKKEKGEILAVINNNLTQYTKETVTQYDNLQRKWTSSLDIAKTEMQAEFGKAALTAEKQHAAEVKKIEGTVKVLSSQLAEIKQEIEKKVQLAFIAALLSLGAGVLSVVISLIH